VKCEICRFGGLKLCGFLKPGRRRALFAFKDFIILLRYMLIRLFQENTIMTLHRPGNVDDLVWLRRMLFALSELSHDLAVVFPVHPRTQQCIADLGLEALSNGHLRLLEPKPYLEFLGLQWKATLVITDSGGVQEETSFLGVPCLTMRENTERPITLTNGTNVLVGRDIASLQAEIRKILSGEKKNVTPIPLWDGHAAERIADVILRAF